MQSNICINSPQKHQQSQQSQNLGYISEQAKLSLIFNNSKPTNGGKVGFIKIRI